MQDSCMLGTTHSTEIQLPAKRERTGFCLSVMNNLESYDLSKDVFKKTGPSTTLKEKLKKYMCPPTVQPVVQYKKQFEDTHSHSQWGDTAQVHNVRLCSK